MHVDRFDVRVLSCFKRPAHYRHELRITWWGRRPRIWTFPLTPTRKVP